MAMESSDSSSTDCENLSSGSEDTNEQSSPSRNSIVKKNVESRSRKKNTDIEHVTRIICRDVSRNLSALFQKIEDSPTYTRHKITKRKRKTRRTIHVSKPSTSTAGLNGMEIHAPSKINPAQPSTSSAGLNGMEIHAPSKIDPAQPGTSSAGLNGPEIQAPNEIDPVQPSTSAAGLNGPEIQAPNEIDPAQPSTSAAGQIIPLNESQNKNEDVYAETFVVRLKKKYASRLISSCREKPGIPGKRFDQWERVAMLQYLINRNCVLDVAGLKVWQNMIADNVLPHRTAASLNNHFRKSLIYDLRHYELPKRARKAFREVKRRMLKRNADR